MIIEIRRIRIRTATIDGQLWIDGDKVCDTAENGKYALPCGQYYISVTKCHQHARKMPKIRVSQMAYFESHGTVSGRRSIMDAQCKTCIKRTCYGFNTPMPTYCPMLTPGNGIFNRNDGAILLGSYLCPGCLSHPKAAFDALYDRIRKSAERGNYITLIIENYEDLSISVKY